MTWLIYKWHFGRWGERGNRVVEAEENTQLKTGAKYQVLKINGGIYKIVDCKYGLTTVYLALSVFNACIILKIAHK